MIDYANRYGESDDIILKIKQSISAVFVMAGQAVGITSFLKERLLFDLQNENTYPIYINASIRSSFSDLLIEQILKDMELHSLLQHCFDESYGTKNTTSVFQDIPYIGNTLSLFLSAKNAPPIYTGNFNSAVEEVLTTFFEKIQKKFVIIIDEAQNITEDSYSAITDLIEYSNITFVFAITEDNINFLKLKNLISLKGFSNCETPFCPPNTYLVMELGKVFDKIVPQKQAIKLIESTNCNIHKIVETFLESDVKGSFDCWELSVISILKTFALSLKKSDLFEIIKLCPLYSSNYQLSFNKTIHSLLSKCIISEYGEYVELCSLKHPTVLDICNTYTEQILYKKIILSYYNSKNDKVLLSKSLLVFLYNIALELEDSSRIAYARIILKTNLLDGTYISNSVISNANLDISNMKDCILASIVYARKRDYLKALNWLEKADISVDENLKAFYGILLNRVRRHEEAEGILIESLESVKQLEYKVVVSSYLISNYIHQEKLSAAQKVFQLLLDNYRDSSNIGYLIRNATSAFAGYRNEMYDNAMKAFLSSNDMFGYYTTMCNKATSMLSANAETSRSMLYEAYNHLKMYGENITHIIMNNLGIANLLCNEFEEAKKCFCIVIANESCDMPQIFAKINLACCNVIAGKSDVGLKELRDLERIVEAHPLDRVRQKYYINRLFVEYFTNQPITNDLIKKAQNHLDRYSPEKTLAIISFYQKNLRSSKRNITNYAWRRLFLPCNLAYWFIDPLKIFPKSFLDQIIVI